MSKKSVTGFRAAASAVAFNSMGTGPAVNSIEGGTSKIKDSADDPEILDLMGEGDLFVKTTFTAGTGVPAIAANNVVITLPVGVNPKKVFLSGSEDTAPRYHVASIVDNVISIGTKSAPAASSVATLELICVM